MQQTSEPRASCCLGFKDAPNLLGVDSQVACFTSRTKVNASTLFLKLVSHTNLPIRDLTYRASTKVLRAHFTARS